MIARPEFDARLLELSAWFRCITLMRFLLILASLSAALTLHADEPPIIAKARAYLGTEDALNAVKSVSLEGKFTALDSPESPTNQHGAAVTIIFEKPFLHRLVVTGEAGAGRADSPGAKIIVLDGYDAWQREPNPADPSNPALTILGRSQIEALRADVWENLGYYRGLEAIGGSVEDQGPATIDGVACEKVAFIHSPTITYFRYFDLNTGRLVFTETKEGLQIREEGEIIASGIKFPAKIITTQKLPTTGAQRVVTLSLEHIMVNNFYAESVFAVPLPKVHFYGASGDAPAAAPPAPSALPSAPAGAAPLPSGLAP
jgi:hypothetical protein